MLRFGILFCLLVGYLNQTDLAQAQDSPLRPVHIISVGGDMSGVTRRFFGRVVARQTVDLGFQVAGQITEFPASEGAVLEQGALIARLDLEPFELELTQAQLRFDQAERAVSRLNRISTLVSEVERENAETEVGLARVALRNATLALERATLLAPFEGLVASRNVANFSTVAQGSPVVRLHDMSELRLEIDVPEVLFQRAGENADVTLEAQFPARDELFPLEVREYRAEASEIGQTFQLTLALSQPNGLSVLPGSSATVFATLNTGQQVLTVPPTALRVASDGSTSVMRFIAGEGDRGQLQETTVTVEANSNGEINVVSGLNSGDLVVRTGAHAVNDGDEVRRFSGYPN